MTDEKIQVFDQSLKELKLERKVIDNLTKPYLRNIAQFSDGYIIALVEKTVFIFSEKGEYIHEIILENNADISADIESYSLNPYKYDTDYHYYIIAFIISNTIKIQYYKLKIDLKTKKNSENFLLKDFDYEPGNSIGMNYALITNSLSCHLMQKDDFDDEILVCFYEVINNQMIEASLFAISNDNIAEIELGKAYSYHDQTPLIIKSVVSRNKKNALICHIYGYCQTYDVDLNQFTNEIKYFEECEGNYASMNIYYFQEKDKFMFACKNGNDKTGFNIVTFDSSFHPSNTNILDEPNYSYGNQIQNINTFNLLYLSNIKDYAFISDYTYDNNQYYIGGANLLKMKGINNLPNEDMEIQTILEALKDTINESILNDKDPNKTYIMKEEDYTLIIKPIDENAEESTVNIDFSKCKEKLNQKYPNKQFRIVQINLHNSNENCLNDQVEYKIFDEDGQSIELSICKDITIKVGYQVKDTSKLNIPKMLELAEKGIDIFDIKSEFYNDICYPYSNDDSDSDMILFDRVSDIYQNYSLCGKGCKYDSFNTDKMTAYCDCEVKQEVSTDLEEGNFQSYIKGSFFYSNFGIIKCYKVVFELKDKLNNVGFWIFGVLIIFHFPIEIYHFIKGTNPMEKYINKEMNDKGYISKSRMNSIKKKNSGSLNKFKKIQKNNKKTKKSKKRTSINESNNPPPKNENKKGKLNDRIPESNDIIYKNNKFKFYKIKKNNLKKIEKDYDIPIEENNKKRIKDLKTINPDETQVENNYAKEKIIFENFNKNIKRTKLKKYTHKNFKNFKIILTDSNEVLDTNEEVNYKKKIYSDKNVKKQISEEEIEENNKYIKKKENQNYSLILINANNTGNHHPLKSNYLLNNYDYEEAIKYDKRSFLRIFFIYLISKDNILNIIFLNPPLELKPLRLCIFIFGYSCDLALNAFFYLSENISDRYHYTGLHRTLFCLINNLIISFISTIVSIILLYFFQSLTQSSNKIENLFKEQEQLLKSNKKYKVNEKEKRRIEDDLNKIIKCLRIKIICFIIFEFLFMLFFFYYVTAFCQIYHSTQISWLLDSISSYWISLLISFSLSLVCSIFYIISIKYRSNKLYKIVIFIYEFS